MSFFGCEEFKLVVDLLVTKYPNNDVKGFMLRLSDLAILIANININDIEKRKLLISFYDKTSPENLRYLCASAQNPNLSADQFRGLLIKASKQLNLESLKIFVLAEIYKTQNLCISEKEIEHLAQVAVKCNLSVEGFAENVTEMVNKGIQNFIKNQP